MYALLLTYYSCYVFYNLIHTDAPFSRQTSWIEIGLVPSLAHSKSSICTITSLLDVYIVAHILLLLCSLIDLYIQLNFLLYIVWYIIVSIISGIWDFHRILCTYQRAHLYRAFKYWLFCYHSLTLAIYCLCIMCLKAASWIEIGLVPSLTHRGLSNYPIT